MSVIRTALVALLVCAAVASAGDPIDPTGMSFTFASLKSKSKAKAKGIGGQKLGGTFVGELFFGSDQSFVMDVDGTSASGTWTRNKPTSKRLELVLDSASKIAVAQRYAFDHEWYAPIPIDVGLVLDEQKTKLAVVLKTKKKAGTITAKLRARLRFTGTTDGGGKTGAPTKVKAKLKGASEPEPLP